MTELTGRQHNPDPHYSINGPMDSRLWEGRHLGADGNYAAEVARRLGDGSIVVQHGKFSWGVYKPRFRPIEVQLSGNDIITLMPECVEGEWIIAMRRTGEGLVHAEHPIIFTRGDLATMMGSMLPDAAALLDSMRAGRARAHGNSRMGDRIGKGAVG